MDGPAPHRLLGADLGSRLHAWAAAARVDEAARARARQRWLRSAAEEGATLAGLLADLAAGTTPVRIGTRAGRTLQGRVVALGRDFCAVAGRATQTLAPLRTLATVRVAGRAHAAGGHEQVPASLLLADVLHGIAEERCPVAIDVHGGERVVGELRWVGAEVLAVRTDHEEAEVVLVGLDAIDAVDLR
jgi:hypothetical protein